MSSDWSERLIQHPLLLPASRRKASGGTQVMAILEQYRITERFPPARLDLQQRALLRALAEHAVAHSPHFAGRLASAGLTPATLAEPGGLTRLAPLTRRELVDAKDALFCRSVSPAHGQVSTTTTSGSTGEPVTVRRTQLCQMHWLAHTLREHLWHDRDFSARLAVIRANATEVARYGGWGAPCQDVFRTGPGLVLPASLSTNEILRLLVEFQPGYLLLLPGVLRSLLDLLERTGQHLESLRGVRTLGETVTPSLREDTRRLFGCEIDDVYSSQEGGIMATQCPEARRYHVAETVIMEVVDARGEPCAPGKTGRILITDLLNLATPLVRYEIGDYAEVGAPCACGRGLPTITRFMGRERNLVLLPDGSRHYPVVGYHQWQEVFPVRQFQVIQLDRHTIEARFSAEGRPTVEQEERLTKIIQAALGHPFDIGCVWQREPLPRGPGGKFEEFICLATDQPVLTGSSDGPTVWV